MVTSSGIKLLVLDTNAWLFHYGLGPEPVVNLVRLVAGWFAKLGYGLGYTSPTIYEIRRSPRQEIAREQGKILRHISSLGNMTGPSIWQLLDILDLVEPRHRLDAAIAIAAGGHILLTLDPWLAVFRLSMGAKMLYLEPGISLDG